MIRLPAKILTVWLFFGCTLVSSQEDESNADWLSQPEAESGPTSFIIDRRIPNSVEHYELHLFQTRDEIYAPVGVRRPLGRGDVPVIIMSTGNGRNGVGEIEDRLDRLESMMNRILERGYAVAYVNVRNEIPNAYAKRSELPASIADNMSGHDYRVLSADATLDSDDYIYAIRYLEDLPWVTGVGAFGISHSGELILKAAAETDFEAGVVVEGASHEFLAVDTSKAERSGMDGTEMQLRSVESVEKIANKDLAMARIRQINTPILNIGRQGDHLEGLFLAAHEWMIEADRNSTWSLLTHQEHGFPFHYESLQTGEYKPDEIQERSFEIIMDFFDEYLQKVD